MWGKVWLLGFLGLCVRGTWASTLEDYTTCCHYCRGDQDLWIETKPRWDLMVGEDHVTDFISPPAYLMEDEVPATAKLYEREYNLRYAGAPVSIVHRDLSKASAVLNDQYVQVDLGFSKAVSAVVVQGGYYEEMDNDLLDRKEVTIDRFAVSTSHSKSSGYSWVKNDKGAIMEFEGGETFKDYVLAGFDGQVIQARYVRLHPLQATDQAGLDADDAMLRLSVVHCTNDACVTPRANCIMRLWSSWGECTCDWADCRETRERGVARYQACGGAPCEPGRETRLCVPPEPLWKSIALYVGIAVLVLLVIFVVSFVLYKKLKKPEPEVVFEKEPKKKKKAKKERKSRNDVTPAGQDGKLEEATGEEANDILESELYPNAEDGGRGGEKNLDDLEKGAPVVVEADDQPVVNADQKPVAPLKQRPVSGNSVDRLMHELGAEEETDIEGLTMIKRDEVVAGPAPKPKVEGKKAESLASLVDIPDGW